MRRVYQTSERGFARDGLPYRLWRKAKQAGVWDPESIDFAADRADWLGLAPAERDILLRLTAMFQAGEESVAHDLLPLLDAVGGQGRIEEEMFLASFLWEEAKHVELFRRFFDEVAAGERDLSRYHTESFVELFDRQLPASLNALAGDRSPAAIARAGATYNMIVEGVLAETGYHAYHSTLTRNGILPGMQTAIGLVQRDESRHIAYGVFLLSRLLAEHGDPVWKAIETRMSELLPLALGVIQETFALYDPMPFGLQVDEFAQFAILQFQRRYARLELARGQSVADLLVAPESE